MGVTVVETPISQRVDRVVGDICALLHDNSPAAKQRALRWIAHVLNDAEHRRRWWFLERSVLTMLQGGEDVIDLKGHMSKLISIYAPSKLNQRPLGTIVALRTRAIANNRNNAGMPGLYAIEHVNDAAVRVHLWPAPAGHKSLTVTANAATDELTVPDTNATQTGLKVQLTTDGTLPAPLASKTTYYVIRVNGTTVKLATSLATAKLGTAIDLTSAGTGNHTLLYGLTPCGILYTRPMDLAITPNLWETIVLNGVLGKFGRHFDRDQLTDDPEAFEQRFEAMMNQAAIDTHDTRILSDFDTELASEQQAAQSEAGTASSYLMPASLTGVGYVTIETGDYPLVVG